MQLGHLKIEQFTTPEIQDAVSAYLLARAAAEVLRPKVDAVFEEVLARIPVYATRDDKHRVLNHNELYLVGDDAACMNIYKQVDTRCKQSGIKPVDMPEEICPALVAETRQREAETLIVEVAGKPLDIDKHKLTQRGHLDDYFKFIDLVVKLTLATPDYVPPKL